MLNAIFHVLQLSSSFGMRNLCVRSINLLYHLENVVLLKAVFYESNRECQGLNIFSKSPLSTSHNGLPMGGINFSIANISNK